MVEVRVQTLVIADNANVSVLVLCPTDDEGMPNRFIPIWVGLPEAALIGMAIEDIRLPRPSTHDLFIDAITNFDAYVDHVLITTVRASTFFAKLTLRHHGRLIELDARPSDAIALAAKQNAPLYVMDEVFEKASFPFEISKDENDEKVLKEFHDFVAHLNPDDFLPG